MIAVHTALCMPLGSLQQAPVSVLLQWKSQQSTSGQCTPVKVMGIAYTVITSRAAQRDHVDHSTLDVQTEVSCLSKKSYLHLRKYFMSASTGGPNGCKIQLVLSKD